MNPSTLPDMIPLPLPLPLELAAMAVNLSVATACGFALSWLYRTTNRSASYSPTLGRSLITLALITAIVIAVVGNNLARAFGLVGAMSIIRFRTALKDPQDLVFVFFSLTIGLAAGVGLHALAVLGTLFVGAIILFMSRVNYGATERREFVLQLALTGAGNPDQAAGYAPVFERFCEASRLLSARAGGGGDALDLTFFVTLSERQRVGDLTRALADLPGIESVNLFHDEEPG